jgi:serine phosphatase RsbU (regulator of sigma subunit)
MLSETDFSEKLKAVNTADRRVEAIQELFSETDHLSEAEWKNYTDKLSTCAVETLNKNVLPDFYLILGTTFEKKGNYSIALKNIYAAYQSYLDQNKINEAVVSINRQAKIYANLGDYSRALDLLDEGLTLSVGPEYEDGRSNVLNAFSVIYQRMGDGAKAKATAEESLALCIKSNSTRRIGVSRVNLGNAEGLLKNWNRAIAIWEESLNDFKLANDRLLYASSLGNIGIAYIALEEYEKAEKCVRDCMEIKKELNDQMDVARAFHQLGMIRHRLGKKQEAEDFYLKALDMVRVLKTKSVSASIYRDLVELYKEDGRFKEAFEALEKSQQEEKELFTHEMNLKARNLQMRFDVEKMEKENEIYRLKNIDLAEANKQITAQKETIEQKNKDITDSILYAQRIQQALLPSVQNLRNYFQGAFALNMPRDIVSGDFYWSLQNNETVFLAVADCTGHGVPGASFLSEIVSERGLTDPAEILNLLRLKVITALQARDENENSHNADSLRDGMDIILCKYHSPSRILHFACANNSPWILRGKELIETEADKFPVGLHHGQMQYFRSQQMQLQSGDQVFLFTDGYIDQFGGPLELAKGGKRFGSRRLRDKLLEISNLSSLEQETILRKTSLNWKGELEQTDDILLLGIRI